MPAYEFETGNLTLAVMQMDAFGQEFKPSNQAIALRVGDVAATRAELESKGVTFVMDDIDSGVCHMAYCRDPDGNTADPPQPLRPQGRRPGRGLATRAPTEGVSDQAEGAREGRRVAELHKPRVRALRRRVRGRRQLSEPIRSQR